jgi:hypothetical protein
MTQPKIDVQTFDGREQFVVITDDEMVAVPTAAAIALAESILLRYGDQDKALVSWLARRVEELTMQVRQLNAENREVHGALDECLALLKKLEANGVAVEVPQPPHDGSERLQ